MSEKQQNLQDTFLNAVRKSKASVTIFLVNGVKLRATSPGSTISACCCAATARAQLVYKHAISTVMPMGPIQLQDEAAHEDRLILATRKEKAGRVSAFVIHVEPRTAPHRIVRDAEARLAEAVGLTARHRSGCRRRPDRAVGAAHARHADRPRQGGRDRRRDQGASSRKWSSSTRSSRPVQQRNLEKAWGTKVLDRTALILEIFGERAATGKGGCRWNWPISPISARGWSEAGPIWSANAAASAFWAAPAKPRSKPTAA